MPKLDYLDGKFIDFTQNNIELIDFCLSIDSSYRDAFNQTPGSSAYLITHNWAFKEKIIKDICERIEEIDKQYVEELEKYQRYIKERYYC